MHFYILNLFYTLDDILIRNTMAGYINMWNLHHAYAQNVNIAIKWA
jgi:hypothetical protein